MPTADRTVSQLAEDGDLITYLVNDRIAVLKRFLVTGASTGCFAQPSSTVSFDLANQLIGRYMEIKATLQRAGNLHDTTLLRDTVRTAGDSVRLMQGMTGAVVSSLDWQSPAFGGSGRNRAGVQNGQIKATISDYKRDRHYDEEGFEEDFAREFLGGNGPFTACHVTSSGMAAATTALVYLGEKLKGENRKIALGTRTYFEVKELAQSLFSGRIVEFDEADADGAVALFDRNPPAALIVDTYTNTLDVAVPDVGKLAGWFNRPTRGPVYVLIDNTCLSIGMPLRDVLPVRSPNLTVIGFESLNKFYQFGMDRITGGVVWGEGSDIGRLFTLRDHLGTNITDHAVWMLPHPNRGMLTARLKRLGQHTAWLAGELDAHLRSRTGGAVSGVNWPGLPSSPWHKTASKRKFGGAFFTLRFAAGSATVATYRKYIDLCVAEARKRGVDLVTGTSFGFDTTRIYLTAMNAKTTVPFVRIAPGTETDAERTGIRDALLAAIDAFG